MIMRKNSAGRRIFRSFGKSGHTKYGAKLVMAENATYFVVTKMDTRPRDLQNNKTDKWSFSWGKSWGAWPDSNRRPRD